jgi:hypothetical protein
MKLFKKLVAVTLGTALTLSMVSSALASDVTSSSQTVGGNGDIVYIDKDIYSVVLPTSENFNFVLDPQGLSAIATGSSLNFDDLQGGSIIGGAPVGAKNNSSYPVMLTVDLRITGAATAVNTKAAVEADTNNNILIYMEPTAATVTSLNATDTSLYPDTAFVSSGKGYPVASGGTTLTFSLDKADYTVTKLSDGTFDPNIIENTGAGTLLQLGGFVNTKADWSTYTGDSPADTVALEAEFAFSSTDTSTGTAVAGIPGLKSDALPTALEVEPSSSGGLTKGIVVSGEDTDDFVYTDNYTTLVEADAGQWVETGTLLFYDGGLGIKKVTSQDDGSEDVFTLTSTTYGWNADTYNFAMKFGAAATKTIVITLEDDSTYSFKIKVS